MGADSGGRFEPFRVVEDRFGEIDITRGGEDLASDLLSIVTRPADVGRYALGAEVDDLIVPTPLIVERDLHDALADTDLYFVLHGPEPAAAAVEWEVGRAPNGSLRFSPSPEACIPPPDVLFFLDAGAGDALDHAAVPDGYVALETQLVVPVGLRRSIAGQPLSIMLRY